MSFCKARLFLGFLESLADVLELMECIGDLADAFEDATSQLSRRFLTQ